MHCPQHPNIAVRSVVTPIPTPNVLQKVSNAMHAVATTISLHCASREDNARQLRRPCEEAIIPNMALTVIAELHVAQAAHHVGTAAEALAIIALPGPLSAVPHIVLPIANHPSTMLKQIGAQYHTGTTRTL